ncbi:NUDIX domain-containing protein [Microbacterium protaetiae]|uniref:NUDIX domain-containing protein n=1 Tax=Microbacterium protaetiae TaxID=2509458 RepID=A0A4P6EG46_9MICO|nr:NUDIX domain-containing protein [Microbacterium protaetiae]QAY61265.1 NUDIX domain-containing protein [Microbacterium protaetiae]
MIDPGESARQAAIRELEEETAVVLAQEDLAFLGTATFDLRGPDRRERAAVFGMLSERLAASSTYELTDVAWLELTAPLSPEVSPLDAAIALWAIAAMTPGQ